MKCSHCGEDVVNYYIGISKSQPLCKTCLMELSSTSYKPVLCTKCHGVVSNPLVLRNSSGIFCSDKCFAESLGFKEFVDSTKEVRCEVSKDE